MEDLEKQRKLNILRVKEKYGDNKWWESEDLEELAYNQLFERILLVDFSKFHEGIEKFLGRPVFTHEFGLNLKGLKEEAKRKKEAKRLGHEQNENYADIKVNQSIKSLVDFAEKTGKEVIPIEI